jgi:hypothetical protein
VHLHLILLSLALLLSGGTVAAATNASPGLITQLDSYSSFEGRSDVGFRLDKAVGNCVGVWLKSTDPGFKQNASLVLSAYMADKKVVVWADDSSAGRWSASGDLWCRVESIRLQR